MITGDAVHTALSIAQSLGLRTAGVGASTGLGMGLDMSTRIGMGGIGLSPCSPGGAGSCLTGAEMDEMDDRSLMERVSSATVFACMTPRHKMHIVKAYQRRGEIVAMTGDGGGSEWFGLAVC
jgi:Ca2+-transporting ATPase